MDKSIIMAIGTDGVNQLRKFLAGHRSEHLYDFLIYIDRPHIGPKVVMAMQDDFPEANFIVVATEQEFEEQKYRIMKAYWGVRVRQTPKEAEMVDWWVKTLMEEKQLTDEQIKQLHQLHAEW